MGASCAVGCPYGLSCAAPGQCPRFTDSGDGICDLGQPADTSTATATSSYGSDGSDSTSVTDYTSSASTPDETYNPSDSSSGVDSANTSVTTDQGTGMDSTSIPTDDPNYFVLPISIILVGLYLFTHLLFNKGVLSQQKHRRIWNLLLTAGTAGTGITGILLILIINLGVKTALNPSITFWHAELSILMVLGTLIHIHIYWKPFKNMFRVLFGFKNRRVKNSKKPASILAVVMLFGMILVSGQYLNLSLNGEDNSDPLNGATNTTSPASSPTTANYQYENTSETSTSDESNINYNTAPDSYQDLQDTSTSGNRNGKNRN